MVTRKSKTTKDIQKEAGRTGAVIDGRVTHADYDTHLIDPDLAFVVFGLPAPQGSKKSIGNNRFVEASKNLAPWRNAIREEAKQVVLHKGEDWLGAIEEPVLIEVVFTFEHTAASQKRKDVYVSKAPDLDKLQRAVGDALCPVPVPRGTGKGMTPLAAQKLKDELADKAKEFAIIANDSYITAWHSKKVYVGEATDALKFPGVSIEVWRLSTLHEAMQAAIAEAQNRP